MEKFKELSFEEMQEVEGGYWMVVVGVVAMAMLLDIALNPNDAIETIKNGFNDGKDAGKN